MRFEVYLFFTDMTDSGMNLMLYELEVKAFKNEGDLDEFIQKFRKPDSFNAHSCEIAFSKSTIVHFYFNP